MTHHNQAVHHFFASLQIGRTGHFHEQLTCGFFNLKNENIMGVMRTTKQHEENNVLREVRATKTLILLQALINVPCFPNILYCCFWKNSRPEL